MTSMPPAPDDWRPAQVPPIGRGSDRRMRPDRRQRIWWAFLYGSVRPRRRQLGRRTDDGRFQATDWHGPRLWAVSIAILILSVTDAFMTVTLMSGGAIEVNPFMAALIGRGLGVFASLKIAMTGVSVMLMVFLARYRFMRLLRVEVLLYGVLVTYLFLIGHEMGMLHILAEQRF
jgi:Domain of unknown function (DUF5658)